MGAGFGRGADTTTWGTCTAMREDIESSRAVANRVVGRADQPKTEMLIGGPR
jgi:hypothetical protein